LQIPAHLTAEQRQHMTAVMAWHKGRQLARFCVEEAHVAQGGTATAPPTSKSVRFRTRGGCVNVRFVRAHVLIALLVVAAVFESGCTTGGPGGVSCLPSDLHLSSTQVRAGSKVTVSSGPFGCQASYPAGKTYRMVLALFGRARPMSLGTVPVNRDGSFRAVLRMPHGAPPGEAVVEALGSAYDRCVESASCAGYGASFTLLSPAR
jgi:hypothetical protein